MLFKSKAALSAIGASVAGGLYFGVSHAPDGAENDEKVARGEFMAGAGGVGAITAFGLYKSGVAKSVSKLGLTGISSALKTKTGMFVGGGSAIGAAIGAYNSDDSVSGAAKGAAIGAASGAVVRAAMGASLMVKASKASGYGAFNSKLGMGGAAVLGTIAAMAGAHVLAGTSATSSYSSTSDSGETQYSDTPIRRRVAAINATGDVVLGLHRKRRG